ncbi:hypothetical protein FSPOR_11755 [Fusarium sporotrichioides]|uniref:RING-type domain-containing protein n=1 Tax=Fusarium sporotrichioides TaxID=5514 RepID=A0A395RFI4_FUSSP|nr:hypothetical protein FSPOR_11755 [Fusarium sporotrichioides]
MCPYTESAEFKAKTKETYWPVLKASLQNGDLFIRDLDLDCPICYDNMGVHPIRYGPKDEHGNDHRAVILACGHMVGKSCVRFGDLKTCPICRTSLEHLRCGHNNKGRTVPWVINELDSVPAELSNGGIIPSRCDSCRVQGMLNILMGYLSEIDNESQARKKLPPRRLGISMKVGGLYYYLGDQINGMKSVLIETPDYIKGRLAKFRKHELLIESHGYMWTEESFKEVEVQCFTFEKSSMAAILDIYNHLEAYGSLEDSDDEDDENADCDNPFGHFCC